MLLLPQQSSPPMHWSPSALQRMTQCGQSYHLRYVAGHRPRQHAAAWFGSDIIHRIIQRAYHGHSLEASFEQVWTAACAPIAADLQAWLELDRAYRLAKGAKRSDSKEASSWGASHPAYGELRTRIDAYQRTVLASLRWNERSTLADYYRRSAILTEIAPEQVLLPSPWLVEGEWLTDPFDEALDEEPIAEAEPPEEEEEGGRTYRMLEGTISGISVRGVPDVVARREDGVMLIGDYKTSAKPLTAVQLSGNMQLLIYCELLRQNGILLDGQPVLIGHISLSETTVTQVWAEPDQSTGRRSLMERQFAQAERRRTMGEFVPVAGIMGAFHDPCPTCDMAHVCDAIQVFAAHA